MGEEYSMTETPEDEYKVLIDKSEGNSKIGSSRCR